MFFFLMSLKHTTNYIILIKFVTPIVGYRFPPFLLKAYEERKREYRLNWFGMSTIKAVT